MFAYWEHCPMGYEIHRLNRLLPDGTESDDGSYIVEDLFDGLPLEGHYDAYGDAVRAAWADKRKWGRRAGEAQSTDR